MLCCSKEENDIFIKLFQYNFTFELICQEKNNNLFLNETGISIRFKKKRKEFYLITGRFLGFRQNRQNGRSCGSRPPSDTVMRPLDVLRLLRLDQRQQVRCHFPGKFFLKKTRGTRRTFKQFENYFL